jgi:hypothetical protein
MTIKCSAAVPAAVRRASLPAAPRARRPFGKLRPGSRDSLQDAGATVGTYSIIRGQQVVAIMPPSSGNAIFSREITR